MVINTSDGALLTARNVRLGWRTLLDPVHFVALGFGAGLVPRAPGTLGTLVGVLPAWWCFGLPMTWRIGIVAAVIGVGIWFCGESARRLGVHDHGGIVFDEIAGFMLTALALPENTFVWLALAFVLFRIFDVWKPWPIREVDHRLKGGVGIMLDDLMAAAYAAACLLGLRAFLPTT